MRYTYLYLYSFLVSAFLSLSLFSLGLLWSVFYLVVFYWSSNQTMRATSRTRWARPVSAPPMSTRSRYVVEYSSFLVWLALIGFDLILQCESLFRFGRLTTPRSFPSAATGSSRRSALLCRTIATMIRTQVGLMLKIWQSCCCFIAFSLMRLLCASVQQQICAAYFPISNFSATCTSGFVVTDLCCDDFWIPGHDHIIFSGSSSRDMGDQGSVLIREKNVPLHRGFEVELFTRYAHCAFEYLTKTSSINNKIFCVCMLTACGVCAYLIGGVLW